MAKQVKIPAMFVDLVVVDPDEHLTYLTEYCPAYAGEIKIPMDDIEPLVHRAMHGILRTA